MKLRNTYYIIRHGQNIHQISNKKRKKPLIYPWPEKKPIRLTLQGKKEVLASAKILKKKNIGLIYSSDMFRAKQTSEILAKELKIKKITFDKRLRDGNLGIYNGRPKEVFYKEFFVVNTEERFAKRPKGGESWNDIKKRTADFIKSVDKKYKNKNVLLVSHGDPLWLLESVVRGYSNKKAFDAIFDKKIYKLVIMKTGGLRKLYPF